MLYNPCSFVLFIQKLEKDPFCLMNDVTSLRHSMRFCGGLEVSHSIPINL